MLEHLLHFPLQLLPYQIPSYITTIYWPIYWQQLLKVSQTAIITWHSRDFAMKRHTTDKIATLNYSVTSFTPSADILLGAETLLFATGGRFVYCTISSFFIESHVHHAQSHALPRKHRRMCWSRTGSCYVNKTVMSHMQMNHSSMLTTLLTINHTVCSCDQHVHMYMHKMELWQIPPSFSFTMYPHQARS